jgi:hypothetical protein
LLDCLVDFTFFLGYPFYYFLKTVYPVCNPSVIKLQVKVFQQFILPILNVSRQCLANGEDDVASIAFEIFDELIESPAPLLGDSVRSIVQFSLEVCSSPNLDVNIRHQVHYLICFGAT